MINELNFSYGMYSDMFLQNSRREIPCPPLIMYHIMKVNFLAVDFLIFWVVLCKLRPCKVAHQYVCNYFLFWGINTSLCGKPTTPSCWIGTMDEIGLWICRSLGILGLTITFKRSILVTWFFSPNRLQGILALWTWVLTLDIQLCTRTILRPFNICKWRLSHVWL